MTLPKVGERPERLCGYCYVNRTCSGGCHISLSEAPVVEPASVKTMAADDFGFIADRAKKLKSGPPEPWQTPSSLRPCAKCGASDIAKCTCDRPLCPCGQVYANQCCCG